MSGIDYTPLGYTPAQVVVTVPLDKQQKGSVLWNVTKYGTISSLAHVLEFGDAEDIEQRAGNEHTTALQEAVILGDPDRVVLLCRAGASLDATIRSGDLAGSDVLKLAFVVFKSRQGAMLDGVIYNTHREQYIYDFLYGEGIRRDQETDWSMYCEEMLDMVFAKLGW
jgi:hypothetical protein